MTTSNNDVTDNLDTICNGFGFSDLICKEKEATNEGYYNYDPIPYPAPNRIILLY